MGRPLPHLLHQNRPEQPGWHPFLVHTGNPKPRVHQTDMELPQLQPGQRIRHKKWTGTLSCRACKPSFWYVIWDDYDFHADDLPPIKAISQDDFFLEASMKMRLQGLPEVLDREVQRLTQIYDICDDSGNVKGSNPKYRSSPNYSRYLTVLPESATGVIQQRPSASAAHNVPSTPVSRGIQPLEVDWDEKT